MEFIDFRRGVRGGGPDILFPGWQSGEAVAFYSPHDDDAILGAGYLIRAVIEHGGAPHVLVFCRGDAGYSTPAEKAGIVAVRREETVRAYSALGVPASAVITFEAPDFGLMDGLRRDPSTGSIFDRLIVYLRLHRIGRIVFTSGNFEHWDHTAAFYAGIYTSPQAGDPILADLGPPSPLMTYLQYAVWSDFAPGPEKMFPLAADKAILGSDDDEAAVRKALSAFASQGLIMSHTVAALRDKRRTAEGFLELYQEFGLRRPIDFEPYEDALKSCRRI
jgi:LmbE family N-acetylglucosaminyl deacetylase